MLLSSPIDDFSASCEESQEDDFLCCLEQVDLRFQQAYWQLAEDIPCWLQPYFLTEEACEQRLAQPQGQPEWLALPGVYLPGSAEALTQRLQIIVANFELTVIERDLLVATLPLLYRMFSTTRADYFALQSALNPASPLFHFHLLVTKGATNYDIHDAVWYFLCSGSSSVIHRVPYPKWVLTGDSTWCPAALRDELGKLCLTTATPPLVVLEGQHLDGRRQVLATILAEYHRPLLSIDIQALASLPEAQQQQCTVDVIRDAMLDNAALALENQVAECDALLQMLERLLVHTRLQVFILPATAEDTPLLTSLPCVHLTMPQPTIAQRIALLTRAWPQELSAEDQAALQQFVERYLFNPADARLLMQEANYYCQLRNSDTSLLLEGLRWAALRRSRKNFGKLAQRITPTRGLQDVMLAPEVKKQLDEVLAAIRLRESATVKRFSQKAGGKVGLSALFHGESGTGKTLAAEAIGPRAPGRSD